MNENASSNKSLNLRDLPQMLFSDSDRESLKIVPSKLSLIYNIYFNSFSLTKTISKD